MKKVLILTLILCSHLTFAQKTYEPTWESLDSRENPAWYGDAKFGIFIHWGLYSVPAFGKEGTYAEWYWYDKNRIPEESNAWDADKQRQINAFHTESYGRNFPYEGFANLFTCEFFEPTDWAKLFKQSGAKYVVLTSKHHEGYCLWPNQEASESFGRPWNSVEVGPKRDLVGDLTEAVRAEGLKMGLYYSIWDWYNPLWTAEQQAVLRSGTMSVDFDLDTEEAELQKEEIVNTSKAALHRYTQEVMYPQFKELVNKYQPALLFSDGDWWMDDELWETKPLLSWLFNNAPNKDEVVINDRWGKGRSQHGGYYTTEYGSGFDNIDKDWEENRGIGHSFGYNRNENLENYKSSQELIYVLVDIVSRGGNLLLNIGPRADGTIPVIMQQRLADIGAWLAVNGEAIYGSECYKHTCQWSDGIKPSEKRETYNVKYDIMGLTVSPKEGMAVKEVFFTEKGNDLYCICPVYPTKELRIKGLEISGESTVSLLGGAQQLAWSQEGRDVLIVVPDINPSLFKGQHAWTFKIADFKQ